MAKMFNGYIMSSNVKRDHHLWTRDTVKNVTGEVTLDIAGDLTLDCASGSRIYFKEADSGNISIDPNSNDLICGSSFKIDATGSIDIDASYASPGGGGIYMTNGGIGGGNWFVWVDIMARKQYWYYDVSNHFAITVEADGATTMTTLDQDGAVGHLTLDPDGDINLNAVADVNIPVDIGLIFGDGGEKIESNNTDLTINSGVDINLTATNDVNIPADVGLTFGTHEKIESDDTDLNITVGSSGDINIPADIGLTFGDGGEKIEGDGTDLTIAGNIINLSPDADVKIPVNKGLMFGTHEKIESDDTDLSITVGSGGDINIPADIGLTFGDDGEKIEGDGTKLTIASSDDLDLTVTDVVLTSQTTKIEWGGTGSGEHIVGAGTNELTIAAGADINLTAGGSGDINIPTDIGLTFGDDGEKIEGDGTDLTISSSNLLTLAPDGGTIIDRNVTITDAGTYTGLSIDYDKTEASTSTNTMYGLNIDMDNTTATNGTNVMTGISCTPTLQHAADAGTTTVTGAAIVAVGHTNGSSTTTGLSVKSLGADTNYGLIVNCADGGRDFQIVSSANNADFFQIAVGAEGETTILTEDFGTAVAHLNIEADGHVEFDGCAVGFDLQASFQESSFTLDFRLGNKALVTITDDITDLSLQFPNTSGNFVLLIKQSISGSQTVANYKVMNYLGNGATGSASLKFAGGSNPTLTTDANHVDIISIFWDADNQIAYGVATLDFQF